MSDDAPPPESSDKPTDAPSESTAKSAGQHAMEGLRNIGRFARFLGMRVVLNIIFSPVVALIVVVLGFFWTSSFGMPNNIVTATPLIWFPVQLISLAVLGGLMWGAMEATRRLLRRLRVPLHPSPGHFLRLLTVASWLLGSLGVGRLAALSLPLIAAWNLPMWLAGFMVIELALYFAIELTLCRLFPRFKPSTETAQS